MEHQKKVILIALMVVIFVLVVSLSSWYVQLIIESGMVCSCAIPLPILLPVIASVGLLIGTLIYSMYSPGIERKPIDRKSLLMFFEETEQRIMDTILSNRGEVSQARIVKLTGLPKVKVFRSLEKLKMKGIIEKESKGKTNTIRLTENVAKLFQ
ncbi:MAG: hypothetical protein KAU24_04155 [Candidatus Aenigmarchaeota archaeon]|nr:hypothetical protein [Candidatus Aenigmarchaeota archaeon]